VSFSFPPATKFAPNSRNDAFLARNAASIRPEWGKPRSSARSRTIYLNFAFIVALCDYLYHTTRAFSGIAPLLSLEFQPLCVLARSCKRNDDFRSADRDVTRKRENKRST